MSTTETKNADDSENRRIETFKALNTLALELFKALNVLNAGAAAGMLAGLNGIKGVIPAWSITLSISFFVFGLMFGLFAMLCGWFTLYKRLHLTDRPNQSPATYQRLMLITLLFALLGLICFCTGALVSALNINLE